MRDQQVWGPIPRALFQEVIMRKTVMFALATLIVAAATASPADAGKKGKKPPKETQNTQQEYYHIKMNDLLVTGRQSQSGKSSPNANTSGAAGR
jgi:hypothetical protein